MQKIFVNCGNGYSIIAAPLASAGQLVQETVSGKRILIVTDERVGSLFLPQAQEAFGNAGFDIYTIVIHGTEAGKTLSVVESICERLYTLQFTRQDTVVALGGGIVGDMAGFAASIYMRGLNLVQLPTTVIAQADSAVGGKTGVNMHGIKNMLGSFYQPSLVILDTAFLQTLPKRDFSSGMAEVVKYGCIADKSLFNSIGTDSALEDILLRCCDIKRSIIEQDEHDMGLRHSLNFGHTIAHAIEAASGNQILHGEAVAMGMVWMSRMGEQLGITKPGTSRIIQEKLLQLGLSYSIPQDINFLTYISADKKRAQDTISEVFITEIGSFVLRSTAVSEYTQLICP